MVHPPAPTVRLPGGDDVAALGQGTWTMGDDPRRRRDELASLRTGLDLGLSVIDTAEMYGSGAAEELVAEAIAGRRDEVFLVDKVVPNHATRAGTVAACRASLERLGTDRIDLYLLHWPGRVPVEETVAGFVDLQQAGAIRHWGVSNFDANQMAELARLDDGGGVQTDQVLYNLSRRGPEFDLLPQCAQQHIPVMAYSPIEQGRLLDHPVLSAVADRHDTTTGVVALAWVLRRPGTIVIPKTSDPLRVAANAASRTLRLSDDDLTDLDAAFPAPKSHQPLEMI